MPEMLKKQYVAKSEVDDSERTITAVISTNAVDRDGEVLMPKGADFEKYLKNPVVLWAHQHTDTPIGRSMWIKRGRDRITAKVKVATTPKADEIYQLFKGGFLNAFSVGFVPNNWREPKADEIKQHPEWSATKRVCDSWELLEFSAVPVPANPEALAVAVKTKAVNLSKETQDELGIEDEETFYTATIADKRDISCDCRVEDTVIDIVLKPFPSEHACRLNDPGKYDRFARNNCEQKHDGKCIDVIYGFPKTGGSEIQALRYPKDVWAAGAAHSHCNSRDGSFEAASGGEAAVYAETILAKSVVLQSSITLPQSIDKDEIAKEIIGKVKGKMFLE